MKRNIFGILAVALAITLFAFTPATSSEKKTDLVWFQLDSSGDLINPGSGGIKRPSVPSEYQCINEPEIPCAFGYNETDVVDLGDGVYGMPESGGTFDPYSDYQQFAEKAEQLNR